MNWHGDPDIAKLKNELRSAKKRAEVWKKLARRLRDQIRDMEDDFGKFKEVWLDCLVGCADYRTRQAAMRRFFHFLEEIVPLTDEEQKKVAMLCDDLLRKKIAERKNQKGGDEKCQS